MNAMSGSVTASKSRNFCYPVDFTMSGRLITVARVREELEYLYDVEPDRVMQQLRDARASVDVFSFWHRLDQGVPEYAGHRREWDNVAAVPISTYDTWYKTQVHQNTRNKIRKSQKEGIAVKEFSLTPELAEQIADIFNESQFRQGRHFAHFGKSAAQVEAEWSSESDISTFVGAFYEDRLVGFIKLLDAGRYYRTSGTIAKLAFRSKAPMNALIAHSVRICADRRVPYLVYGKFVYGTKGEDSLTEFKRHNGFLQYQLPRYFVPLTSKGALAVRLGLHRRLRDTLPRPIVRAAVRLRRGVVRFRRLTGERRSGSTN